MKLRPRCECFCDCHKAGATVMHAFPCCDGGQEPTLDECAAFSSNARQELAALRAGRMVADAVQHLQDECSRLRAIQQDLRELCRHAHDRLLRGDSDRELLAILEVGYGPGPYIAPVVDGAKLVQSDSDAGEDGR